MMKSTVLITAILMFCLLTQVLAETPKEETETQKEEVTEKEDLGKKLLDLFGIKPGEIPAEEDEEDLSKPATEEQKKAEEKEEKEEKQTIPETKEKTEKTETKPPAEPVKETLFDKVFDYLFGKVKPQTYKSLSLESMEAQEERQEISLKPFIKAKEIIGEQEDGEKANLEKIIADAIKNSPEVQKAKIDAELVRRQNTFTPVPSFTVGNDLASGKTAISASIQIPLEPLFTGKQREKQAEAVIKQRESEIKQRVIEQYRTIITTSKKIESRQKKLKYAAQLVKNAEEQYKGGMLKLEDLIKAQEILWSTETEAESLSLDLQNHLIRLELIKQGGK